MKFEKIKTNFEKKFVHKQKLKPIWIVDLDSNITQSINNNHALITLIFKQFR